MNALTRPYDLESVYTIGAPVRVGARVQRRSNPSARGTVIAVKYGMAKVQEDDAEWISLFTVEELEVVT